jgi:hypothetical protein
MSHEGDRANDGHPNENKGQQDGDRWAVSCSAAALCKVLKNAHMFLAPPTGLKVLGSKPEWSSGHMT